MADNQTNLTSSSFVMAALAVSGGLYFYHNPPLHGARPELTEAQVHEAHSLQNIEARLWQDPLAAVAKFLRWKGEGASGDEGKCVDAHGLLGEDLNDNNGEVLGVMLPGGPYAELSEVRRRTRYAVLSGLERRNYVADANDHIGCWETGRQEADAPSAPQAVAAHEPQRRRDRKSVVSQRIAALGGGDKWASGAAAQGGLPCVDSTGKTTPAPEEGCIDIPHEIPFEWFHAPGPQGHRLLVLWLNEDNFSKGPLRGVRALLGQLATGSAKPKANVIGPYSSDTLERLITDAQSATGVFAQAACPQSRDYVALCENASAVPGSPCPKTGDDWDASDVHFYTYAATIDESRISAFPDGERQPLKDYFCSRGVFFRRSIATDRALAEVLVDELDRRQIRPAPPQPDANADQVKDHVALITEWDTQYGRTIGPTFIAALLEKHHVRDEKCPRDAQGHKPNACPFIHEFKYLRGLDGALPRSDDVDGKPGANRQGKTEVDADIGKKAAKDRARAKADEDAFDHPYGLGQQDYLHRLARRLSEEEERLRARGDGSRIAAIGVLGSDVFDKLLVLRALKPLFPRATFFTTDFDHTLAMQSELGWTRNLLVASTFGETLDREMQSEIPPFRGGYETAAFLATMRAAEHSTDDPAPCFQPRLFEIGRTGRMFRLLTPSTERSDSGCSPAQRVKLTPQVDEPTYPKLNGAGWLAAVLVLPLGILALLLANRMPLRAERCEIEGAANTQTVNESQTDRPVGATEGTTLEFLVRNIEFVGVLVLLATVICVIANWDAVASYLTRGGVGEPIAFLEGVSLWPSIVLRAVTGVVSIVLIIRAWRKLRDNLAQIGKDMDLPSPAEVIARKGERQTTLLAWIVDCFRTGSKLHGTMSGKGYDLEKAWENLVFQGRLSARICRVATASAVMFLFSLALCKLMDFPNAPSRAEDVGRLFFRVTMLDVVLMLLLLFGVADATLSFYLFVRELGGRLSEWPTKTKQNFARDLNISDPLVDHWIDIKFIAMRTRCIGELIYYPFAVVALMIISRSTVLANFDLNAPIMITQGVCLAILFACAIALRQVAESARDKAKEEISDSVISEMERKEPKLQALLGRIGEIRDGAFSPISQQAPVRAVLLPLASIGLTALTDYGVLPI